MWTEEGAAAFTTLKCKLIQAPILGYPQFTTSASPFVLQTDAGAVGLGAVLEQDNKVITYASQAQSAITVPFKRNVWESFLPQSSSVIIC